MKNKNTNGLHRAELTTEELQLLVRHYAEAEDELAKAKSPILLAEADRCCHRRQELERMFDGRWTNRGKGRKPKPTPDPGPDLPMTGTLHSPNCICADCEERKAKEAQKELQEEEKRIKASIAIRGDAGE